MLSGRTTTTVEAPARGPFDYNAIRPSFGTLAPMFALSLLALLPIVVGVFVGYWSLPGDGADVRLLNIIGMAIGGAMIAVGLRYLWPLSSAVPDAVTQWYAMVYQWHNAELEKYESSSGMVTAIQVSEWSYSPQDMRHVALAFLWLLMSNQKSLSIEKLTKGGLLLNAGHRAFKLMDMTQDGAAQFLDLCARAGVISGRGPRAAGTITIMDPKTALLKVLNEAAKDPTMIAAPLENEP